MRYIVQTGECLASIAYAHGFFPQTLWDLAENAALRELRKNPNLLAPGDAVEIPEKRPRLERAETGALHQYQQLGVPEKLRLQFSREGKARAAEPYVLVIDGVSKSGVTDSEGKIEQWLPPDARECEIQFGENERYPISLRAVGPVDEVMGQRARLTNLGFFDGGEDDAESLRAAFIMFQATHQLPLTGEADSATRAALVREHGS